MDLDLIAQVLPWLVVAFPVAGVAAYQMQRQQRILRALRRQPRTRAADVRAGAAVRISGIVEYQAPPLYAPLSDRPCAHYRVVIKERRHNWTREILREERGVDFCVRDESGAVLVRPSPQALTDLQDDHWRTISPILLDDEKLQQFLTERGIAPRGWLWRRRLKAYEAVIVADRKLTVAARAQREESALDYREPAAPKPTMVLAGCEDLPLIMSDG